MRRTRRRMLTNTIALVAVAALLGPGSLALGGNPSMYSLPNWFEWGQEELDVLVVPPATGHVGIRPGGDPLENKELDAVLKAITVWEDAIDEYGAQWLRDGLTFNIYVLGEDLIPPDVLAEPNIVMASHGNVALDLMVAPTCLATYGVPLYPRAVYSIGTHEFGHCLGLNHTVDKEPPEDIMSSATESCPSNLNILAVERAFATVFNQPGGGDTAVIDAMDYEQISCDVPR